MTTSEIFLLIGVALIVLLVAVLWFAGLVGAVEHEGKTTVRSEKRRDEARKERS